MANTVVNTVLEGLRKAGFRAGAAWPGQTAPELSSPAVTVSLFQVNQQERVTEVLVTVLVPGDSGGDTCEEEGLKVTEALTLMGASCVQEGCEYDGRQHQFRLPIYAAFTGGIWKAAWNPGVDVTVMLGEQELYNTAGFTARQETEDPETDPVSACPWRFTLEEFFYPGDPEQVAPEEPFTMTVSRTGRMEVFRGCRFLSILREDTATGLRQIRQGISAGMGFIEVE